MKMFKKTREKIGCKLLKSKASRVKRSKVFSNFDTASSVGILFDSTKQLSYLAAKRLKSFLEEKGKRCNVLGAVVNSEMLLYFPETSGISFFCLDSLNIFELPISKEVDNFISTEYDILVNLFADDLLCIDYVIALSKAKFKISPKLQNDFADLTIDFKDKKPETEQVIERVKSCLAALTPKN